MQTPFRKMHGAGNDFIVMDARVQPLDLSPVRIAALADRQTGIGCDQFITLEPPPPGSTADVLMRIHNPDGSEAGACGNATRCVAGLLHEATGRTGFLVETISGLLPASVRGGAITVDMGAARLSWQEIPLACEADTLRLPVQGAPAACSLGNPHATLFVPDIALAPVNSLGPMLEHHAIFPDRANIGFAQILAPNQIRLRVWERGAGLTRACGSGACAALVNAVRLGLADRGAEMILDGGTLHIEWRDDGHVLMTGAYATAFNGVVELAGYPK